MRDQPGAGPRLRAMPAWARSLSQPWPELDVPAAPALDVSEHAGSLRRAKRLLKEAARLGLGPGKLVPLLQVWDGLLATHRARIRALEEWDLVEQLRERAGLPASPRTRAHEGNE